MHRLTLLAALLLMTVAACSSEDPEVETVPRIFVGTSSGTETDGVYAFRFDPETGALTAEGRVAELASPSYLTLSPNGERLYAVSETDVYPDGSGAVNAFEVDAQTGALAPLGAQSSRGRGPCYVSTDRTGRWVLAANYGSGSVALFPVRGDGGLDSARAVVQHRGSSVDAERQEGPHAHFIDVDPENAYALAADLGTDEIRVYDLGMEEGTLAPHVVPAVAAEPGAGPRHLAFHPGGAFVYVVNELNGTVTAYAYDDGRMDTLQTISTLPEGFDGYNKSADIHVHPSGRFLYASNRGDYDSVAIFVIDEATGRLTPAGHQREGITWPRNFAIDPSGRFLLVANQRAASITVFRIDEATGALSPTGHTAEVPAPTCVKFR